MKIKDSRSAMRRSVLLKEFAPFERYNVKPPDSYMIGTDGLEQKNYHVQTDANGFVLGSSYSNVNTSKADIIFFGGSTTACLFVEEDSRFPFLVQNKLIDKSTGKNIHVLNAGVSGNNTLHSLVNFISKGIKEKPEVVILMHNINDLVLLSKTGSYWIAPNSKAIIQTTNTGSVPTFKEKFLRFAKELKDFLFPNIYEQTRAMAINLLYNYKGKSLTLELDDEFRNFRDLNKPDFNDNQLLYKKMLLSFSNVAKANNIKVVLMTQFNRLKQEDIFVRNDYNRYKNNLDYDTFCFYYSRFNQIIRELSESEELPLIDLDVSVPKSNKYIFDAAHLNTNGSRFVASIIADKLTTIYPEYFKKSN